MEIIQRSNTVNNQVTNTVSSEIEIKLTWLKPILVSVFAKSAY